MSEVLIPRALWERLADATPSSPARLLTELGETFLANDRSARTPATTGASSASPAGSAGARSAGPSEASTGAGAEAERCGSCSHSIHVGSCRLIAEGLTCTCERPMAPGVAGGSPPPPHGTPGRLIFDLRVAGHEQGLEASSYPEGTNPRAQLEDLSMLLVDAADELEDLLADARKARDDAEHELERVRLQAEDAAANAAGVTDARLRQLGRLCTCGHDRDNWHMTDDEGVGVGGCGAPATAGAVPGSCTCRRYEPAVPPRLVEDLLTAEETGKERYDRIVGGELSKPARAFFGAAAAADDQRPIRELVEDLERSVADARAARDRKLAADAAPEGYELEDVPEWLRYWPQLGEQGPATEAAGEYHARRALMEELRGPNPRMSQRTIGAVTGHRCSWQPVQDQDAWRCQHAYTISGFVFHEGCRDAADRLEDELRVLVETHEPVPPEVLAAAAAAYRAARRG